MTSFRALLAALLLCALASAKAAPAPVNVVIETDGAALQRLAAAKNATKQAVVGRIVAPLVAGALDDAEDVGAAAASAQAALDKKLTAAGLPTTAALVARAKNATVVPAKGKARAAIKTLRNATDTAAAAAWDAAAKKEVAAFAYKTNVSVAAANLAEVAVPALKTEANVSSSLLSSPRPDKAAAIIAAARNASSSAVATKRAIEDAALDSDKGKARFSVLVTIDAAYNPAGGNGVEGSQYSPTTRPGLVPVLSQLGKAKQSAIDGVKAAVNATFPGASAAKAAAVSAVGFGHGNGSSSSSSALTSAASTSTESSSVPAVSATSATSSSTFTSGFIAPITGLIPSAEGTSRSDYVSFSAATVLGLPGDTFFSPSVVDPFDIANAVRALLVSKLRRLASEGSAEASSLLSLGDASSTDGQRTAAPLLSARGVALDPGAGAYLVSVSFPSLLPGAPLPLPATKLRSQLINAVNDVSPDDPCGSLAQRTGFDVCNAIDDATHLTISKATLRAVESSGGGTGGLLLPFGRRSKSAETTRTGALSASAPYAYNSAAGAVSAADLAGVADPNTTQIDFTTVNYIANALGEATGVPEIGAIVGELTKFVEEPSAFGFISGAYNIFSSITGLFSTKGPSFNEQTLTYLSAINATTFKILEGINVIEAGLAHIETEIRNLVTLINSQSQRGNCDDAIDEANKALRPVIDRWNTYNENTTTAGPRYTIQKAMEAVSKGKVPPRDPALVFEPWVKDVLRETGAAGAITSVRDALDAVHSALVVLPGKPGRSVIRECATYVMTEYRNNITTSNFFAFDDRQYFSGIQKLLSYYQVWQARGSQMIQEALTFRAQQAALSGWAANQAVPGCNTKDPGVNRTMCIPDAEQLPVAGSRFCAQLTANWNAGKLPENQGFVDAVAFCETMKKYVDEIADHMYAQEEEVGAPLSWGNAGEGVRLLLGSDVTKRPARISGVATQTKTEWLVAASPGAFFSYCADPGQYPKNCPLIGNRSQPSFGMRGYTLGYDSALWKPAGKEVWVNSLRGMQPLVENATGDAASLLSIMETGNDDAGAVPFKGIRDRTWWIHDATFEARLTQLGLNGTLPLDNGSTSDTEFYAPKGLGIKNAYCFASVGPVSTRNGPSGVVCASEDLEGIFEGECREQKLPSGQYFYFKEIRAGILTSRQSYIACLIKPTDWVSSSPLPVRGTAPTVRSPLAIVCPIGRSQPPYRNTGVIGLKPECGLARPNNLDTLFTSVYIPGSTSSYVTIPGESCPVGAGSEPPIDVCLDGNRLGYWFWNPNSFDAGGNQPTTPAPPPPQLHRLPALNLADIQPAKGSPQSTGSCRASWDSAVPVLCGADKTRYLVAKLGSRGKVDTTSWPARGANNETLTTARVQLGAPLNGELAFNCFPDWRRADGSQPSALSATPVMTSRVITQSAGPIFAGEEKLAWASGSAETGIGYNDGYSSISRAYPSNATLSTGTNRFLPRVVTCSIRAVDPGNNGLPVYAVGSYLAVANATAPGGIELRPNFSFPA